MHREEFYVRKEGVMCTVMTTTSLIVGTLHKRVVFRLMDELLKDDPFLAMTDVVVKNAEPGNDMTAPFLALQKDQIVWVMPHEEEQPEEAE
jgi:hypothetical protein